MLKSTHRPVEPWNAPPLPEGWTEHRAPTGHSYYYHASTKQSTYTRPASSSTPVSPSPLSPNNPSQSFLQYQALGGPNPSAGSSLGGFPAPLNGFPPSQLPSGLRGFQGQRGGQNHPRESRPQPVDKPRSRHAIPDCSPWQLVHTKYGRRFAYNSEKNQSYWRIPDKLKDGIVALDQLRIKQKAEALTKEKEDADRGLQGAAERPGVTSREVGKPEEDNEGRDDSSEYEEVEVTDDEDQEGNPPKRQRTEDPAPEEPIEFNENDIAYQLAAMGQEYGLEPGEYDDGNTGEWEEGIQGLELNEEDSAALFKDLLDAAGINPYSPWEKLVEEGKLVDDTRYTALTSMRARKEVWEEWSRERVQQLRELRAKEEKNDPRIPYLAFLQRHATPKLYWPEFKRKYRKESEMRDAAISDRDREKLYRDHINRLKLAQSTLKSDLSTLLKNEPLSSLNNTTLSSHLPPSIVTDLRYISLDPSVRDPLVEAYITTLGPPPKPVDVEESGQASKERKEKERRQKALDNREKHVAEEKRRQKMNLEVGKGRLREEKAEIARAMNVTKKGLRDMLMAEENTEEPIS